MLSYSEGSPAGQLSVKRLLIVAHAVVKRI